MNTIIKIGILCVICAATLMSGCMESEDNASNGTIVDATIGKVIDTEDCTDRDSYKLPITATIEGAMPGSYSSFTLYEDETVEQRYDDEILSGTWKLTSQTDDSKTYDIFDLETGFGLTIWDDGTATIKLRSTSVSFKGTWVEGTV